MSIKRFPFLIGILGSILGIIVGFIEFSIGSSIPELIGNKEDSITLGIVTMLLCTLALASNLHGYFKKEPSKNIIIAIIIGQLLPVVICFTTVGLLWFILGPILLLGIVFQIREYWINKTVQLKTKEETIAFQIMGRQISGKLAKKISITCSIMALSSVFMGFFTDFFSLYYLKISHGNSVHYYWILPMDFIKHVVVKGGNSKISYIENTLIMIIYVMIIIGGALALIASLTASRPFIIIGGIIILFGLILFILLLPGILQSVGYNIYEMKGISTLGLGWYVPLICGMLIILGGLFINN